MSTLVSYVVFDPATGGILRTGQCPEKMVGLQPSTGQSVMIGTASDITDRVTVDRDGRKTIEPRPGAEVAAALGYDGPLKTAADYRAAGASPELARRAAAQSLRAAQLAAAKAKLAPRSHEKS